MNLYRRSVLQASLVLLLACAVVLGLTIAAHGREQHKLRATALVEMTTTSSGSKTIRIVPITILDNGVFNDASLYKARPQPMALDSGVVYEAQKSGKAVGYVTVGAAKKEKEGDGIWTAQGRWQPVTPPKAQPSASFPTANPADDRPILHRGGSTPAQSTPAPTPKPSASPAETSAGDDRPVLHRSNSDAPAHNTPAPTASPAAAPSPAATPVASTPEQDDPDRPTLRHRTPQSVQEQETKQTKPTSSPSQPATASGASSVTPTPTPAAAGAPALTQTLVAVSDTQPEDPRSFEFDWKPGELEQMEAKMRRLAAEQLPGDRQSAEKSLTNVVIRSFDLDLSNEAVMVLTAEIPGGYLAASAKPATKTASKNQPPAGAAFVTRYVTLIARVDFDLNPQKIAASLTDSSRLDIAPRLELIDAVDVDGAGVGELLFREIGFGDQSFLIYRIGRSTLTKLFEGASQPLK